MNILFSIFLFVGLCSCGMLTLSEVELAEEVTVDVIEEAEKIEKTGSW